jgi:dTDP-4-amino-4,6-dideoxygalactose transaminase
MLEELLAICMERNIEVIEDAAESIGVKYLTGIYAGKYAGTIADVGCYSFNGNKIITTGGGGMILTNDSSKAEKARYLTTQAKDDEEDYIHNAIGYNFRLTNLQAAVGVAQLEQLPEFIKVKKSHYIYYKEYIDTIPGLKILPTPEYAESNYWLISLSVNKEEYGHTAAEVRKILKNNKVQSRPVWRPNHLQKPYLSYQQYQIDKAEELYHSTINIPSSAGLSQQDLNRVIEVLKK